ncbi:MAG: hypothetical protein IH950_16030 [Bacteroidetes bacterium]|nr:hypothetical protein [Bacteroidota bacterium]
MRKKTKNTKNNLQKLVAWKYYIAGVVLFAVLVLGVVFSGSSVNADSDPASEIRALVKANAIKLVVDELKKGIDLSDLGTSIEELFTFGAATPSGFTRVTISEDLVVSLNTTLSATTTISNSFDGFTVGGGVIVATGTPITIYTHSQGEALCNNHTAYSYWNNIGSGAADFAPDLTFSVGTTTVAGAAVNNIIAAYNPNLKEVSDRNTIKEPIERIKIAAGTKILSVFSNSKLPVIKKNTPIRKTVEPIKTNGFLLSMYAE